MIRSAYLAPSEFPTRSLDVKRALLTYDRVYIPDPGDRELIPPQSFMSALGMPFFGFNTGPVRPFGKIDKYDDSFDQLMDELKLAHHTDCIEVISTYELDSSALNTIGAVQMGNYPLNPEFILWSYRNVCRDPGVIRAAIEGDNNLLSLSDEQIDGLSIELVSADGEINGDPALPIMHGPLAREHLRGKLSAIARARIASSMKSIGYCASKDLVPVFGNANYDRLVSVYASRAADVIDHVAEEDAYWLNRRRALEIAHDEYLDEKVLADMPIEDVLKLRSSIWGNQATARDDLLNSTAELARQAIREEDFDKFVREKINSYRHFATEVQNQRSSLSFSINCELFKGAGAAASSLVAGNIANGMLSQMQTAIGAGTVLLAGCLWAVDKIQNNKAASDQLRIAENEFQDNVCFGMHNFYREIAKSVGSDNLS